MKHQAILITTDGVVRRVTLGEPIYQTAGRAVGGMIEIVRPGRLKDYLMIIDDCGKLCHSPINLLATTIYANPYDEIVGDALIMKEGIVDDEPDIVGLDDDDVDKILKKIGGAEG